MFMNRRYIHQFFIGILIFAACRPFPISEEFAANRRSAALYNRSPDCFEYKISEYKVNHVGVEKGKVKGGFITDSKQEVYSRDSIWFICDSKSRKFLFSFQRDYKKIHYELSFDKAISNLNIFKNDFKPDPDKLTADTLRGNICIKGENNQLVATFNFNLLTGGYIKTSEDSLLVSCVKMNKMPMGWQIIKGNETFGMIRYALRAGERDSIFLNNRLTEQRQQLIAASLGTVYMLWR